MTPVWIASAFAVTFVALLVHLYVRGATEIRAENSVDVGTTADRAFDVIADFVRWKRIWGRIGELSPPRAPVDAGSRFSFTEPGGRRVNARVRRWDRGACLQLDLERDEEQPAQRLTMRFEPLESPRGPGCRITLVDQRWIERRRDRVILSLAQPAANFFHRGVLWRLKIEAEADD